MSATKTCLLGIALACAMGCDGYSTVSGVVVDGDGAPIAEARVRVTLEGDDLGIGSTTDATGAFAERGTHRPGKSGVFDVRVEKPGFRPDQRWLPLFHRDTSLRIVLERELTPPGTP
jgi:hypothetical protein